jgi:16S rRNA (adenine1518-N6/adenine1519-N6)-dimethyltransferase
MKIALKKRYGQHFLRDTGILRRIVALIQPEAHDVMLEIGGGDGALSTRLAPYVCRLLVFEVDRDVAGPLADALSPYPNARILIQDVLDADLAALLTPCLTAPHRLRIVGNLPYNVGTAIIEKILMQPLPITDMVFMLQLEVVERICAAPATKAYGFFSVFCQHYCEVFKEFRVAPACFVPRPRVDSAMITLKPRARGEAPEMDDAFLAIARAAFAYRRKKLANSLERDPHLGPVAEEILRMAEIDGSRRAENLTVSEFEHLAAVLSQLKSHHRRPN